MDRGVGEQVDQYVVQQGRVGLDQRQVHRNLQVDMHATQQVLEIVHRACHRIGQIDRLGRNGERARIDPHHVEQIVEEAPQAGDIGTRQRDRGGIGILPRQRIDRRRYRGQRRPEIVADRR